MSQAEQLMMSMATLEADAKQEVADQGQERGDAGEIREQQAHTAAYVVFFCIDILPYLSIEWPTKRQKVCCRLPLPVDMELVGEKEMRSLLGKQSRQEWRKMAVASGWTEEYQKEKCRQMAFKSLYVF